jgi:hypothetical protein
VEAQTGSAQVGKGHTDSEQAAGGHTGFEQATGGHTGSEQEAAEEHTGSDQAVQSMWVPTYMTWHRKTSWQEALQDTAHCCPGKRQATEYLASEQQQLPEKEQAQGRQRHRNLRDHRYR